jgi:hypothetical protein
MRPLTITHGALGNRLNGTIKALGIDDHYSRLVAQQLDHVNSAGQFFKLAHACTLARLRPGEPHFKVSTCAFAGL